MTKIKSAVIQWCKSCFFAGKKFASKGPLQKLVLSPFVIIWLIALIPCYLVAAPIIIANKVRILRRRRAQDKAPYFT